MVPNILPDGQMRKWKACLQASMSHPDGRKDFRALDKMKEILVSYHPPKSPSRPLQRPMFSPMGCVILRGLIPPRAGRDETGNRKSHPHMSISIVSSFLGLRATGLSHQAAGTVGHEGAAWMSHP